jgi:hypothetical protein
MSVDDFHRSPAHDQRFEKKTLLHIHGPEGCVFLLQAHAIEGGVLTPGDGASAAFSDQSGPPRFSESAIGEHRSIHISSKSGQNSL